MMSNPGAWEPRGQPVVCLTWSWVPSQTLVDLS